MKFVLTEELVREAKTFQLRSACQHCFYSAPDGSCAHEWPNDDQRRWPIDKPGPDGTPAVDIDFCKEFELR